MLKTVTLQEANGLLPLVQEHFRRIHVLLTHLQHLRSRNGHSKERSFVFDNSSKVIKVIKKIPKEGHPNLKKIRRLEILTEREINNLMRLGAVIKGLFPPHIDFLSLRNNEPIFLCWHGGEKEIKHWHHLDDGSPFRQIVAKKRYFGPHVVH